MRTRGSVRLAALGAAVAVIGLARTVAAEAVHFSYTAPASCPAESALVDAISRNGGHLMRAPDELPARSFDVRIEEERGVTGRLVVRDAARAESARTIRGARCEDVVSSLGVLMSLALDPDVAVAAETGSSSAPDITPAPTMPAVEEDAPNPGGTAEPTPSGWRFGASTEGSLGGLGTSLAVGVAAYVDLVHDVPDWSAFAFRLGAEIAYSGVSHVQTAAMDLQRRVLRAEVCPARLVARQAWDTSTIELMACTRFDAGTVQASEGSNASTANTWLATGPRVAVRWAGRHFFFELGGSLVFPLDRRLALNSYGSMFSTYRSEYRVPGMLGAFGLGFGWFVL